MLLFEKYSKYKTNLIEKLTTEEELSGLSNLAIIFLQAPNNIHLVV